jgi:hypothetical protein
MINRTAGSGAADGAEDWQIPVGMYMTRLL